MPAKNPAEISSSQALETRRTVIAATISTICERGYCRASSNEIARRSGVSWGVVQYHFGSREQLLLSVLDEVMDEAMTFLDGVEIVGDTRRDRLDQLLTAVLSYFGRREYIATLQIVWNLSLDPTTRESSDHARLAFSERRQARWKSLVIEAIGREATHDAALMAFVIMWGAAMQDAINAFTYHPIIEAQRGNAESRAGMILTAVEALLDRSED